MRPRHTALPCPPLQPRWRAARPHSGWGTLVSPRAAAPSRAATRAGGPRTHSGWGSLETPLAAASSRAATPMPPGRQTAAMEGRVYTIGAHWYHRERPRHLAPRRRRHQGGTASGSNTPSRRCYRWWQTASSVWLGLTGICASGRVNSRREAGATKAAMPAGATRHRAPAAAGGSLRHHSGWGSPISVSLGLRDSRGGKR